MSDCCCPGQPDEGAEKCPECGAVGKAVATLTLKEMVKPEFLEQVSKPGFRFCRTASCEVVYFHADGERVGKSDVRVRIGLKEREDPVPLCYCFGFTEGMVRDEVEATGTCTIPERIAAEVRKGNCACEVRNPEGSCCLGNVRAVVKRHLMARSKVEAVSKS
jgi:hypothetical protein